MAGYFQAKVWGQFLSPEAFLTSHKSLAPQPLPFLKSMAPPSLFTAESQMPGRNPIHACMLSCSDVSNSL